MVPQGRVAVMRKSMTTLLLSLMMLSGCLSNGGGDVVAEPPAGCTDSTALNHDAAAEVDDGSCEYASPPDDPPDGEDGEGGSEVGGPAVTPLFQSGFGTGVSVAPVSNKYADIVGNDTDSGYDWQSDLEGVGPFGNFRIYYEDGNDSQRSAEIVEVDGDRALEFSLSEAHIHDGEKGRVSTSLRDNVNLTEFRYRVDVKLADAFELLQQSNERISWMTVAEFWNDQPNTDFTFRVTLSIHKEDAAPNTPLTWHLHGQTQDNVSKEYTTIWEHSASGVPVPIEQWFTLDVSIREGSDETGLVRVSMTDLNGTEWSVINDSVWTHHPDDAGPDGFETINTMKLYTSGELLDQLPEGRALVVYWDDFMLWDAVDPV